MKKRTLLFVMLIGALALTGCSLWEDEETTMSQIVLKPSGRIVTQEPTLTGFDRVEAHHTFNVSVTQGSAYSVVVRADEVIEQYLDISTRDDTLVLSMKDNDGKGYSFSGDVTLEAEIVLPSLVGITLSGASSAHLTGIESEAAFAGEVSGASRLSGQLVAGDVSLELSGASRAVLTGGAGDITVEASGASNADLRDVTGDNANVTVSGSSTIAVTVRGTLDAEVSGASEVTYGEGTSLGVIQTSGSSRVVLR